jgi:predicted RNA-binding Zn-ribbon protein involved in translation (DUF1610 family)
MTQFFDTQRHGYHAEVGRIEGSIGSVKIRGEGRRKRYRCPKCGATEFGISLGFIYWDFELVEDRDELLEDGWKEKNVARFEDFFNEFVSCARCARCRKVSEFTRFDKL